QFTQTRVIRLKSRNACVLSPSLRNIASQSSHQACRSLGSSLFSTKPTATAFESTMCPQTTAETQELPCVGQLMVSGSDDMPIRSNGPQSSARETAKLSSRKNGLVV